MEHTRGIATITLSYNQLFLMHQLLLKHQTLVCDEKDDPMIDLLKRLGAAPAQLDKESNRSLALQLTDRRKDRMSTATDVFASAVSGGPKINPLYLQAKNLLLSVLRRLPSNTQLPALMTFLQVIVHYLSFFQY
jgi:Ras GTPase-activating-like protein IQGAP2/3